MDTTEIRMPHKLGIVPRPYEEHIYEDGTICVVYDNGRRGRAQPNGLGTEELKPFLVTLFQEIEDELGAPYVVIELTDEGSVVWVPDGDGTLRRLRALLLEAEVLTPEIL